MTTNFYFPIYVSAHDHNIFGGYDEEENRLDGEYASYYASDINRKFLRYSLGDPNNMSSYFHDANLIGITNMDWMFRTVHGELYGMVAVGHKNPLSEEDVLKIKEFIEGQNADGLGEGFEQQPIYTDEGILFVHFWDSAADYRIRTEEEFNEFLQCKENNLILGGM